MVSRFTRNLGAALAHRDADIGVGQGRRVIDAVADHRDDLALALEKVDQIELLLRVDPRKDALSCNTFACGIGRVLQAQELASGRDGRIGPRYADIAGDGQGGARVVAGGHRNTYPRAAKGGDRARNVRACRVSQCHEPDEREPATEGILWVLARVSGEREDA